MSVVDNCNLISQNLTHNLQLAKTDAERLGYLTSALRPFSEQVILPLNQLFNQSGEGSPDLDQARTVSLELAAFICGYLVRKSTDHRAAITAIEAVSDNCIEPQMMKKLVFYTNQLKKRWNIVEPGGLPHNPRAKKVRIEARSESSMTRTFALFLFLGLMLFVLVRTDLTAIVFPSMNSSKPDEQAPASSLSDSRQEQPLEQLPENVPQQTGRSAGTLYSYTDRQGVVHMVDQLDKVPVEYRKDMKVDATSSATATTPVVIRGNQVFVPVTLAFHGRSVQTYLLLDTGATVTTISDEVAAGLGVGLVDVKSGTATVADGRTVPSHRFSADSLSVGERAVNNAEISILSGSGGKGYDGLLGMNFLKKFRYHLNFEKHIIEWGG